MKYTFSAVLLASALGVSLPALATSTHEATMSSSPVSMNVGHDMVLADNDADSNAAMPNNPRAREEVRTHRPDVDHGRHMDRDRAERPDVDHDRADVDHDRVERPDADEVHGDVNRPDVDHPDVDRPDVERPNVERPETDR